MSKTEGIGESIERIKEPSEAELRAIYEEFEEVVTARTGRLHPLGSDGEPLCSETETHGVESWSRPKPIASYPLGSDGEPLCSETETHGVESWSRPKPIASYPLGYKPFCLYCVREWRRSE